MMRLNKNVRLFADKHLENMGSIVRTLFNNELLTDCTLCCKDGSVKAHKLILAANSSYFRRVFVEHGGERAIFFMHGVNLDRLKELLELIYKGSVDLPGDNSDSLFDLAEELQIAGVAVEDDNESYDFASKNTSYNRDTRFKGQKRVAVDFENENETSNNPKVAKHSTERRSSHFSERVSSPKKKAENNATEVTRESSPETETTVHETSNIVKRCEISNSVDVVGHQIDDSKNLSIWARKERKFKCDLCPSSFKRASHLTRHQLVHTGERPYACNQCDKAFSRHDKLKHHVLRAHLVSELNESLPSDSLYTIGHIQILNPGKSVKESLGEINTTNEKSQNVSTRGSAQKKGRGRPRKIKDTMEIQNMVKRPRGRPRLNPVVTEESKSGNLKSDESKDMAYGELKSLTNSEEQVDDMEMQENDIMEPLVEIKTDVVERTEDETEVDINHFSDSFLENIGLLQNSTLSKVGECTVTVVNDKKN